VTPPQHPTRPKLGPPGCYKTPLSSHSPHTFAQPMAFSIVNSVLAVGGDELAVQFNGAEQILTVVAFNPANQLQQVSKQYSAPYYSSDIS
jgi:hypothetical protein